MEDKKDLQELLERLDQSNRQQAKYARWQCIFSVAAAVCCVGLFVLVYHLMPEVRSLTNQMETVLTNLELVTDQLAGMDLGTMVRNVDTLVATTQEGVEQTMEQMNAIDFEALNRAIPGAELPEQPLQLPELQILQYPLPELPVPHQ